MSIAAPEPTASPPTPAPTPPPAQETDWKAEARKWEARAKDNADKAKQYDESQEAGKSELQKQIDRATKAESEMATLPTKVAGALKAHLVALGVVAKEDEVLLTAADPDSLLAQVKRLGERSDTRRKNGNLVPKEGTNTHQPASDLTEFARNLFQKG